jgi:hypothetical protein
MAKVLNLDALAQKEAREVVIGGKAHAVKPMSVGDYVSIGALAAKMEKEKDPAKQLDASISLLTFALPTADKKDLLNLSLPQLTALTAFVRGDTPEDILGEGAEPVGEAETDTTGK